MTCAVQPPLCQPQVEAQVCDRRKRLSRRRSGQGGCCATSCKLFDQQHVDLYPKGHLYQGHSFYDQYEMVEVWVWFKQKTYLEELRGT